jgi:uncharacterized membrane protein YebE (DUF533 family)
MSTNQEHFAAARQFQEYYDRALMKVGTRAPAPSLGQSVNNYRRETLRQLKRTFLPQNQFRDLKADALPVFEQQLLPAVVAEAVNPAHVPPGELKKIERLDEYGKLTHIDWIGQESFVKALGRPGRKVLRFMAPVDSMNRAIREFA